MILKRFKPSDEEPSIEVKDEAAEEVTEVVEVCLFCRGNAATSCCPTRDEWVRLYAAKAFPGMHCPHEHTGVFSDPCIMFITGWFEGVKVDFAVFGTGIGSEPRVSCLLGLRTRA